MKQFFVTLILFLILSTNAFAQSFEFETIRTAEVPGFFAIRLFPTPESLPLKVRDIFVKNFPEEDEAIYSDLVSILGDFGAEIIEPENLGEFKIDKRNRIIFIGEKQDDFLNFQIKPSENAVERFEQFALEHLGPVFFQDITFRFGGNISEVYPKEIPFWSTDSRLLVGKFEKPMRTLAEVTAISAEGEVTASSIIDLRTFYNDPLSSQLPDLWEKMANPSLGEKTHDLRWLSVFPWVLGGAGLVLVFFSLFKQFPKKPKDKGSPDFEENLSEADFEELEKNLPFEVEERSERQEGSSLNQKRSE